MALAHIIMTGLLDQKQTGYGLAKSFDTSLGFFWQASHQQIYSELRKLERKGWLLSEEVAQSGKPDKVVYQLTALGQQELDAWVQRDTKERMVKDELLAKLYNGNEANVDSLMAAISTRRDEVIQSLALYQKIRQRNYAAPNLLPFNKIGVYLSLKLGIESADLMVRWCDESLFMLAARRQ